MMRYHIAPNAHIITYYLIKYEMVQNGWIDHKSYFHLGVRPLINHIIGTEFKYAQTKRGAIRLLYPKSEYD